MRRIGDWLSRSDVLVTLAIATVAFFVSFALWRGGAYDPLDGILTGKRAEAAVVAMSPEDRLSHIRMTQTLDTIFPFVLNALLIGLALRFANGWRTFCVAAALLAIPADLAENSVQIEMLRGDRHWTWLLLKSVLTPLKFLLIVGAAGGVVVGWLRRRFS